MPSFYHLFALLAIVAALGEEVPPQAVASKELAAPAVGAELAAQAALPQEKSAQPGEQAPSTPPPQLPPNVATAPKAPGESAEEATRAAVADSAAKPAAVAEESQATGAEAAPASEAAAGVERSESAGGAGESEAAQDTPAWVGPDGPEGEEAKKEHDDDGVIEVTHVLPQHQADIDNTGSLAIIPMLAALLSFAGILAYSLVFLCKIFRGRTKSQSQGLGKAAITPQCNNHEDLDFEDLEVALNMAATTPVARKRSGGGGLLEEPEVLPKEEVQEYKVGSNCWETNALSDDGWGDDAWANDGWDDLDDCEEELSSVDAAITSGILPAKPSPPAKGKAD